MQSPPWMAHAARAWIAGLVLPPLLTLVSAAAGAQIGVQRERNAPNVYAITNVRIITVAGPAIDKGTVVLRNGIITAVGANAAVPADARVIDGAGLTVYPGLIDANSSLGLAAPAAANATAAGAGRGAGRGGAPQQQGTSLAALNSTKPVGLQPELSAIDFVHPQADVFAGPQSAGITTALTAPSSGIFRGLSAVVNLGGATPQAMIVKAPIAEHIGFTPGRGGYPNSLLGVFSALRQTLLDAQHYAAENAAYAKNPRSMRRPEPDPSLDALQPVLSRQIPVIMEASSKREIERALDLAKEFNLRAIIAGGEEADEVAARLKAENVPVLATLNFPRRPQASADADPEPLRMLRARVEAPKLAAKLQQAGVRFAFEDGGLSNWTDFLANAGRTVEGGLTSDQAVRALTLSAAEILGVGDRLGTIEPGKIANLTVARGDLFGGRVTHVFVDGVPSEVRAPANAGNAAGMANGTWQLTVTLDEGEKTVTLNLQQVGDQLRGTIQGALGNSQIGAGSITPAGDVSFRASVTMDAGTEDARFNGTIDGNLIRGTVGIVGHPQGTFVGTRPTTGSGRRGAPPPAHRN